MFTGIIETTGVVRDIRSEGSNLHFTFFSSITTELRIDQSVSHNGVCLTVVDIQKDFYVVTAVDETLRRSAMGVLKVGDIVNLERAMLANARLDGHIVQGHVDGKAICSKVIENNGSWTFSFTFSESLPYVLVDKGSICVNGVSLTVVEPKERSFSVAIIPYTFQHTNFSQLKTGDPVNLEFDVIGKYVAKLAEAYFMTASAIPAQLKAATI